MRLIDADRLEDSWDQVKTMIDNVEAQPTVEAIPITWIKKYIDFIDDKCLDEDACNTIRVMLNDWKEEINR